MILSFVEQRNGEIRKVSLECLGEARRLADKGGAIVVAVTIGLSESKAAELSHHGADEIIVVENGLLSHYSGEGYAKALYEVVQKKKPKIIFFPASSMGRDLAPRLAVMLNVSLASDCIDVRVEGGKLRVKRPVYAGKAMATVALNAEPAIITLRPNIFSPVNSEKEGKMEKVSANITETDTKSVAKEILAVHGSKKDLVEADIIVSGGRGMQGPENYKILEELAEALGGVVGASRASVDAGWRPHSDQVGQTGKIVSPKLYIACGISGAIQHQVGMKNARCIVAINKDPEAPIFKIADYGLVGDLFEIVPALTEAIKKLKGHK